MTRPAKNHLLTIHKTGGVTDQEGDSEPVFSVKHKHKASWTCELQHWYVAFRKWPFEEDPDFLFGLRKPQGAEQTLWVIDVPKGPAKRTFTIAKSGPNGKQLKFYYSLINDSVEALVALVPIPGKIIPLETGPEVIGEG